MCLLKRGIPFFYSSSPKSLIEILNDYGLEQDAILLQAKSDDDDQELYDLGKRFAEQLE